MGFFTSEGDETGASFCNFSFFLGANGDIFGYGGEVAFSGCDHYCHHGFGGGSLDYAAAFTGGEEAGGEVKDLGEPV